MDELRKIETGMVPVYETSTGEKVVYGTELHRVLGVKSNYRDWARNRLKDIDAVENEDFEPAKILALSGQSKIDHIIRLDTAKEMAMMERNEKGKQVGTSIDSYVAVYRAEAGCGDVSPLRVIAANKELYKKAVEMCEQVIERKTIFT